MMLLAALATLGACSQHQAQDQNNVFSAETDALKKAQSVQSTIDQGAQRERKIIDQSSGTGSAANSPSAPGS